MIIKSMSRKSKSFSSLYDYLMRDKDSYSFSRNTFSQSKDKENLIREFMKNSDYLSKRTRGKNYLYHELLSLEENSLSIKQQKEILLDLANKYLSVRADNHLAFGVIHEDKDHIHLHLMISANEIEKNKRVRLSKKEFSFIQKEIESYKNLKYKELSLTKHYQKQKDPSKEKLQEQEIKHKRNTKTSKEKLKEDLQSIFKKAASKDALEKTLKNSSYEIYTRGKTTGVIYENKKYRLKTLGLEDIYNSKLNELEQKEQREEKRNTNKEDRNINRHKTKENFRQR